MNTLINEPESPSIGQLYSQYSPDELVEAEETIKRYVYLVWRIYKRLKTENQKNLTTELLNARFKRPRA